MFVLHADADAFFASVEQRDDPRLRGRPVIVGGGVVLAASYEAKAYGIRTAMGGRQARRLCPDAIVVRPRQEAYTEASRAMFAVFEDTSPVVEGLSIDEAFLDGLPESAKIYGLPTMDGRVPTFLLNVEGVPAADVAARLAEQGFGVWAHDNWYSLGLREKLAYPQDAVRVGLIHYNTADEIDRFNAALAQL